MEFDAIAEKIQEALSPSDVEIHRDGPGDPFIVVPEALFRPLASFLRKAPDLSFDTLMCLSGVHVPLEDRDVMHTVYHLYSMVHRHRFVFKVRMEETEDGFVTDTSQDLWPAAEWFEREAFDLLGVFFLGNRFLRRFLLPQDWEGNPLRRDYQEREVFRGISTTREKSCVF